MKKLIPLILIIILNSCSSKYSYDEPKPQIGWEDFEKSINYPENYNRTGVDCLANVVIGIDSTGKIKNIEIDLSNKYSLFEDSIKAAIQRTKWQPANRNGKSVDASLHLSIWFRTKRSESDHYIIINGDENK